MRVANIRKLTEEEIQERLAQYAANPDPAIRDEVVLQYANLVESIGRRFVGACEPIEDLVQEGYIGLIASLDKYDADKGVKFSTYATHFIIGQIKHYLRDKGKIIKEPAWLQELNQKMTRVIDSLNQSLGRQPTEKEISETMQMPESTVRDLLTTREVFKVTSLDNEKDENNGPKESEKIKDDKLVTFQLPLEDKIVLEAALERLKDIERQVIADHFYKGLNQTEIAKQQNISCNYVSHILRNGTKKLRKILTTEEIRDTQMQRTLVSKRIRPGENIDDSMTVIDSATGVYNHNYIDERLDEEISRAFRHNEKLALMLINVNLPEGIDSYIRAARMEDLLYTVAQTMHSSVRKMDVVGRFGETSFAIILPHTSNQADAVAERLSQVLGDIKVDFGRGKKKAPASAQIGISTYPADGSNSRELFKMAAKSIGFTVEQLQSTPEALRQAA